MEQTKKWLPSKFNVISRAVTGELILYNSYTGAIVSVPPEEKRDVLAALHRQDVLNGESSEALEVLKESGFLVPDQADEDLRAKFLHQSQHRTDLLHLIVLPTESCNFRCVYCYQKFPNTKMGDSTKNGLKRFVEEKARKLSVLSISWFGGEPLLYPEIIGELSESFLETSAKYGLNYTAEMSTNGYYLTDDVFQQLLKWQIKRFMITIDGPEQIHDKRRSLYGGGKSFARILENLKTIQHLDGEFQIDIRVNFDMDNLAEIPKLIQLLGGLFSGDERFQIFFRPVGRWGGLNDDTLPVCDQRTIETKIWEFTELSQQHGLCIHSLLESLLLPGGSVCYAAKPHSLVIGPNGNLYKCTCAFDEQVNQVGTLFQDGSVELDYDKLALWVSSGDDQDPMCRSCYFRPSCQGNHCPLYRMKTGARPCPYEKRKIKNVLNLIAQRDSIERRDDTCGF
ncbi:radical SAM protein [Fodinisporobacter ferrooxydans]|uniref:Radical SAM protein n=1 Tax=Fodinisporobacter ferrooxydans TaxID=2901836 RepID=A0ABY4CMZ2_9BACL|nr:radical SAM protein [Alicyclobacillaceae bacterium MYW30-H2]